MLAKIERGKEDFDVVCPSEYIIERMLKNDLLLPINKDFGNTPNYLGNVSPFIHDVFDKIDGGGKNANDYSVGYMWGTTGFLYNTKYVTREEASTWTSLWNKKFDKKLLIKDAFRDVYSPLLIYANQERIAAGEVTLDELMHDASDESIAVVEALLKKAKPYVAGWEADFGKEVMTKENIVTTHETDLKSAAEVLLANKIEKLPVVDDNGKLVGLITYRDITKLHDNPNACKDSKGRLRVAAGIGITPDAMDRVAALVAEEVDAVVLDSAHGHTKGVVTLLRQIKETYPTLDVVVGNIATAEAAKYLIENGADGIKVGIGPGSICTTRIIAGVGVPQLSAIYDASTEAKKAGVPVIADGGLRYSGDIVKALAAGGNCVMVGSMFAGTEESPGETIIYNGRKFKAYRGMGSIDAMKAGSADRYFQKGSEGNIMKLVPEGIVGRVPFKGKLAETVYQLVGGIRAGMGYCGAKDIETLQSARFVRITSSGVTENHPHDITITSETPNYSRGE